MTTIRLFLAIILLLTLWGNASAGVAILFEPGKATGPVVLPHLQNKGLIAEFLDPGNTGLGKSLAYLLWREVLTAISDQAGAGVILAHKQGEFRIVDMLKEDYHMAAIEVAKYHQAPMVLWGEVQEQAGRIFLYSYITLLPELQGSDLFMRISYQKRPLPGFETEIPRSRFNFTLIEADRKEFFDRPLIVRTAKAMLRTRPGETAPLKGQVPKNTVLNGIDMDGPWFQVQQPDGSTAFVNMDEVEVPPRWIEASAYKVALREGPGTDQKIVKRKDLAGTFKVLDMRYRPGHGLWYRFNVDGTNVWVNGSQVRPRFSLPAVHFMAGLYRFQAKRFRDAAQEFSQFIRAPGLKEKNTNLATAYQFKGASELMGEISRDLQPFTQAVSLTPYDPAAYNLRGLASLGVTFSLDMALRDLEQALKIDMLNDRSRSLARAFRSFASRPIEGFSVSPKNREDLNRIWTEFRIEK